MMLERAAHKIDKPIALKLPNILLVGGAGIGKTHFCNALAQVLGLPMQRLDMASMTAVFVLSGNSPSWRGSQAGKILDALATSPCANGMLLLDEIDKMGGRSDGASYPVEGALFTLLEPGQCAQWTDEFIDLPVNAGHLNFIASANDLSALHPAIASRFTIYQIKQPTKDQAVKTLRSIYARALESHPWGVLFDDQPSEDVLEALWQLSARSAQQVLLKAFVRAAREERSTLQVSDVQLPAPKKPSIGFTH
jgi:ATP-dependent Lon protease